MKMNIKGKPMKPRTVILVVLLPLLILGCTSRPTDNLPELGAGFRFSTYGPRHNPGPEYWVSVGERMAAKFEGATPQTIWIVGVIYGEGVYLNFPCETEDPNIKCGFVDMNEETLDLFDEAGVKVWLQVESGHASMDELIDIVLDRYGHHPCVIGFGLDVEWFKSPEGPPGIPVTDEEAAHWVEKVHAVVSLNEGVAATEKEIIDFCKDKLARYKAPKSVEFVDTIPKNPSGKILKRELRDKYWEGADRNI